MKLQLLMLALSLMPSPPADAKFPTEKQWQNDPANIKKFGVIKIDGKLAVEHVLWDRTRCDYVTATQAIEIDWAYKWSQGIGQSGWYSSVLDKEPCVILLVRDIHKDEKYIYRATAAAEKFGVEIIVEFVSPLP